MSEDASTRGELTLEAADEQDLADVISGLTVIGSYSASAGLDSDADRINSIRRRLILENRELAESLIHGDVVATGTDPESFHDGIREILDESRGDRDV